MDGREGVGYKAQLLFSYRLVSFNPILLLLFHFAIYIHSPWDIRECLFPQCALSKVPFPPYASKWIDARKLFSSFYQISSGNLGNMLTQLGMSFEGREHSGFDDSKNIARIVSQMISDGCSLQYNRFISQDIISSIFKN